MDDDAGGDREQDHLDDRKEHRSRIDGKPLIGKNVHQGRRYDRREQRRAGRYRHGKRHIAAGDESHHIRGGAAGRAAQKHHADRNICRKVEQNAERISRKRHDRELCHDPCQYFFRTADHLTEISRRKREAHAEHHHTEEHRNIRTDQLENLGENESENAEDNHPQGEGLVHKLAHFHEIFHIVHSMRF